jgi:hypothetical protein
MSAPPLTGLSALPPSITAPPFPPTSRYAGTEIATRVDAAGRQTRYLRRRFLPDPDGLAQIATHRVQEAERLDTIAAEAYGDPVLSWQLLDANRALSPAELLSTGRPLRITLPAGVPGVPDG